MTVERLLEYFWTLKRVARFTDGINQRFYAPRTKGKCTMVDATPLSIEELGSIRSKIARHGDAVVISDELFERLIASCEQSFVRPMSIAPTDGRKVLLEWPFWSKDYVIGSYTNNGWWSDCVLTGDGPGPTGWIPLPKAAT